MQQLANEFTVLCQQKELTFHLQCSTATLYSDPKMLRRVLQNFLTNAVRYTEKGKVLLGCRRSEHGLEIQVWDTGFGIPKNHIEDIFIEFKRLESGPHAQKNGIGLGLAIAQRTAGALCHHCRLFLIMAKALCSLFEFLGAILHSQKHKRQAQNHQQTTISLMVLRY